MYSLMSKWTILPGKHEAAVHALRELAGQVQLSEPDTWAYTVHTPDFAQASLPTPAAGEVIFFEIYKDEAAFTAHVNGATFVQFVNQHGHLFLSDNARPYVSVEIMTRQAGFVRERAC